MKLFQKTQNWFSIETAKRLHLVCPEVMVGFALQLAFQPNKLTDFSHLFLIDISRDSSAGLFNNLPSSINSYILKPNSLSEVLQGITEIQSFQEEQIQKTTLVLNDWKGLWYLSNNVQTIGISLSELLFQLKFLSDKVNIIILDNDINNLTLNSWALACLKINTDQSIIIEKSALSEWRVGQFLDSEKPNIYPFPETKNNLNINSIQSLNIVTPRRADSELYDNLLLKLAEANSRQDLLIVRKEIQAASNILSSQEKIALSDIYKVHLQRIKLLEDNLLGSPLNIDVG